MGWSKHDAAATGDAKTTKSSLKQKPPKPSFRLNPTQRREFGWNTSFPAEYGLSNPARDFKETLSYTQNRIKALHQQKQLLQSSASAGQILDADVWRNHNPNESTLSHLQAAFRCQQPQPLTDPQDEIRIMKAILIREGLLSRLKGTMKKIRIGDHTSLHTQDGNSVLTLLLHTRESSLAVIDALCRWYQTLAVPRAYIWNGTSYIHRMLDDLNFLGEVPVLADALGVAPRAMIRNPFMMPQSIADRDLDAFRYMASPPPVRLPDTPSETIALAQADAFLIWCCIHVDETGPASTSMGPTSPPEKPMSDASKLHRVQQWQARAELQLKQLTMPMESSTGVHVMDSSPLMKRKGYLPSLSAEPPETLKDLLHHVHDDDEKKKAPSSQPLHSAAVTTNPKYANVKPRVSADPKPHKMKPKPESTLPPKARSPPKKRKAVPAILTVHGMQVSSVELEALAKIDTPPQVVALLTATILILLTPGDLVPKDVSWATARTILATGKDLLRTLHALSHGPPVAEFKLKALQPFVANEKFRPPYLLPLSKPAAVLCAWVLDAVQPKGVGHRSSVTLHDPAHVDVTDQSDLLEYLETDDTRDNRGADVLVVHDSTDPDERILYSGSWVHHGLTYFVTFFLGESPPIVLHLKLYEPQSSCETQATLTPDEIHQLFGQQALAYVHECAWIELCQFILNRLGHIMDPNDATNKQSTHALAPLSQDDDELWQALATPRHVEPPRTALVGADDMEAAVLRIQCATRQKLSRERVRKIRAQKAMRRQFELDREKAPTLYMNGAALRALDDTATVHQQVAKPKQRKPSHSEATPAMTSSHSHGMLRSPSEIRRRLSLVQQQKQFEVNIDQDWKDIEAHAMSGMKHAARHRLSNAKLHDLQDIIHHTAEEEEIHRRASMPVSKKHHGSRQEDVAAVQIQCMARKRLAKRVVDQKRKENRRASMPEAKKRSMMKSPDTAATHIQCLARKRQAKRVVDQKRKAKQHRRVSMPDAKKRTSDAAATQIQCLARKRRAKRVVDEKRHELRRRVSMPSTSQPKLTEQEVAAIHIQCLARQKQARDAVDKKRLELQTQRPSSESSATHRPMVKHETREETAVVHIQCLARQRFAREVVQEKRMEKARLKPMDDGSDAKRTPSMTPKASARQPVSESSPETSHQTQDVVGGEIPVAAMTHSVQDILTTSTPTTTAQEIDPTSTGQEADGRVEQMPVRALFTRGGSSLYDDEFEEFVDDAHLPLSTRPEEVVELLRSVVVGEASETSESSSAAVMGSLPCARREGEPIDLAQEALELQNPTKAEMNQTGNATNDLSVMASTSRLDGSMVSESCISEPEEELEATMTSKLADSTPLSQVTTSPPPSARVPATNMEIRPMESKPTEPVAVEPDLGTTSPSAPTSPRTSRPPVQHADEDQLVEKVPSPVAVESILDTSVREATFDRNVDGTPQEVKAGMSTTNESTSATVDGAPTSLAIEPGHSPASILDSNMLLVDATSTPSTSSTSTSARPTTPPSESGLVLDPAVTPRQTTDDMPSSVLAGTGSASLGSTEMTTSRRSEEESPEKPISARPNNRISATPRTDPVEISLESAFPSSLAMSDTTDKTVDQESERQPSLRPPSVPVDDSTNDPATVVATPPMESPRNNEHTQVLPDLVALETFMAVVSERSPIILEASPVAASANPGSPHTIQPTHANPTLNLPLHLDTSRAEPIADLNSTVLRVHDDSPLERTESNALLSDTSDLNLDSLDDMPASDRSSDLGSADTGEAAAAAVALQNQFHVVRPETTATYLDDEFEDE
ncbi:Aste57867_23249 [Aphanomyces stellatus]|uniref:Aste57867_23249 protein n=1 Tax=Aphanomyces stellatus TaxID=120398 RepID=A0A485LP34_9STRA|nr:hypothetical protein As57867_023178 [Aphanomyces stellatus]VFT99894.1 Aste57867_23249 [Aphanomyces stellatus]